jgi:hypothetical protein
MYHGPKQMLIFEPSRAGYAKASFWGWHIDNTQLSANAKEKILFVVHAKLNRCFFVCYSSPWDSY